MLDISREKMGGLIEDKLRAHFGVTGSQATDEQIFGACAILIRELMSRKLAEENETDEAGRQVHYLSMEFLIGRSLQKNAFNLGVFEAMSGAIEDMGRAAADVFETEPDAGLGNGGLGRLAACFMDSMATLGIRATGYSICYELGIFKQKIGPEGQTEQADNWLEKGENWLIPKHEDIVEVRFGGRIEEHWDYTGKYNAVHTGYTSVLAVPKDMLIIGYGGQLVNTLRLWEAKSPNFLDMYLFSSGEYIKSMEQRTMAEVITKLLYPADDHIEGKELRLKQQYFFSSATAQSIVREHRRRHGTVRNFAKYHVIHINDTHPAIIIPELLRIFMDIDGLGWDEAWDIVSSCVAYTNHTVLSEALERWPQGLIQMLLPRIWEIICEINNRWRDYLNRAFSNDGYRVAHNLIISEGYVNMANLCLFVCFKINGVSNLHGEILRNDLFRDVCSLTPDRFISITNGIDHRRWLAQCNPRLHKLITGLLGSAEYFTKTDALKELLQYTGDEGVLRRLEEIKLRNKMDFTDHIKRESGFSLNPDAIFDVQVKRLHEYKRQLMCAMLICHLQNRLRDNPGMSFLPRTFIFGAKSASGYKVAKRIIRLICSLAEDVNNDPACKGRLQVLFLENYRVSLAEKLMPAAQVSEQISTAGKEASGTGNMKLMMNGAVTIGTLDGSNIEMSKFFGPKDMFIFGLKAHEVVEMRSNGYNPAAIVDQNGDIARVFDRFNKGFSDGESYSDIVSRLLYGGDEFMLLADFESYREAHERLYDMMRNPSRRAAASMKNIAHSGVFAADRAISEYARLIWNVEAK